MTPMHSQRLFPLLLAATFAAPAAAQRGFEWDYPDGLGVRYLLYDRIERATFKAKDHAPELRALFLPKSKADWVRIKGTELAWGMHVYEFPGDDGGNALGRFLQERDPRRTFREFRVDGEPVKGHDGRYFEFVDRWMPVLEVLDRPQPRGPYRYAVSPELGIRFLADKTMDYVDPFVGTDGDNCFARLHPAPSQWLRIDGVPGPVGWMICLHVFPDMPRERSSSDRDKLAESFARFADECDPRRKLHAREFAVRDQAVTGPGTPHRLWRWLDKRSDGNKGVTPCFHAVAAVYEVGGREVALVGLVPANEPKHRPAELDALEKMVTSLEPWSGKPTAPGFAYYNIAASRRVDDREVGVVVYMPIGTEPRPEKKLFEAARRMVQSLEPKDAQK
jgi:hypothetical protein